MKECTSTNEEGVPESKEDLHVNPHNYWILCQRVALENGVYKMGFTKCMRSTIAAYRWYRSTFPGRKQII